MKKANILFGTVLVFMTMLTGGCGNKTKALEDLAYDNTKRENAVYVKEADEYVPYLVLESNYGGNVLLMRKEVLPDLMQYKEHENMWTFWEFGSYYEESSIDAYLNAVFFDSLSEATRSAIVTSTIEVTDKESYMEWNYKTHEIQRNVFLLSSVELGVEGMDGYTSTKEGEPLAYFKNKDFVEKKAYSSNGKERSYWTRTPHLWESYTVVVIGSQAVGTGTADEKSGVRPAFCMDGQLLVKRRDDIIDGKKVFVLETEQ